MIFSHVEPADHLGQDTLDDLLAYRTNQTHDAIAILQGQLHEQNKKSSELEERLEEEYRLQIERAIRMKTRELEAHNQSKPEEVSRPENQAQQEMREISESIEEAKEERAELIIQLASSQKTREENALLVSQADRVLEQIDNFRRQS